MQHNPYAPPAPGMPPAAPAMAPSANISVIEAIKFSFGVGFGNLAMTLLLMLIPWVGPVALMGWLSETHRRLARREGPAVLSFRFGDFVEYLKGGVAPFLVQLVVTMIAMLPMGIGIGVLAGFAVAAEESPIALGLVVVVGLIGMTALMVIMMAVATGAGIRAELTGDLGSAFEFKAVLAFAKRNWLSILGHNLALGLLMMPLAFVGILAFVIGVYFVLAAMQFSSMHLRWQIYEQDLARGGPPISVRAGNGAKI